MANQVYTTTRDGLCALVSPRVAEGVLTRSLEGTGASPDSVDVSTMSRLLRGRVRRELERTLPRRGLRRSLQALDQEIHALDAGPAAPAAPAGRSASEGSDAAPARPGAMGSPPPSQNVDWVLEPADIEPDEVRRRVFPVASDVDARGDPPDPTPTMPGSDRPTPHPAEPDGRAAVVAPPPRTQPPASLLARLADRDDVQQWVWFAPGRTPDGRGRGPEPSRVASAVKPISRVLGRHGALRSLHVQHGSGHVLVSFDGNATLLVAGDDTMNLGAIHATFRALEEES